MPLHLPLVVAALAAGLFGCAAETGQLPPAIRDVAWRWTGTTAPADTVTVADPARYTLAFVQESRVHLRADCNRGSGQFSLGADRRIAFGPIALTRMACPPGSLSDRYVMDVGRAERYTLTGGALLLALPGGAGTMRFERAE